MDNLQEVARRLRQIRMIADECLSQLDPHLRSQPKPGEHGKEPKEHVRPVSEIETDFKQPVRPFIKRHAHGMSGSRKFTLLLARLAQGDTAKEVALEEVEKHWKKMTGLIGTDFNRFFSSEAKDNDWVESRKRGFYNLRPGWKAIFGPEGPQ